jgi:hypothetical protein
MFAAIIMAFAFRAALQSTLPFTNGALELGKRFCTFSGRYLDKSLLIALPPILQEWGKSTWVRLYHYL